MATEPTGRRKLAAILMADVVEYGRHMGENESATIRTLKAHRAVFSSHIEQRNGHVVDAKGDAIMAEFASVVDGVAAAVEIQRQIETDNQALPDPRKMFFRIGINLGDIVEEPDSIYGDGVTVAARLETLAEPGGICISRGAHDQIIGKLPLEYEYLGEYEVKTQAVRAYRVVVPDGAEMPAPTARQPASLARSRRLAVLAASGLVIAAAASVGTWLVLREPPDDQSVATSDLPTIAVLAFRNMSGDPEQEFFGDGIADTIITDLSKLRGLFVISSESSFSYKGQKLDVRQIGRDLGVRYVLEGGVQKAGEQIRINVQLIEAATGHHLWAERYDRPMENIFELQDEITQKIVTELDVHLAEGEQARVWRRTTDNPGAYEYFLRGRKAHILFTKQDQVTAIQELERALELDPEFTIAMVMLGWTHEQDAISGWSKSVSESYDMAFALARRAIELDPELGDAHTLLGNLYMEHQDFERGFSELRKGVELNPRNAKSLALLSGMLAFTEMTDEGLEAINKAIRINPIPPSWYLGVLADNYHFAGRPEEAIDPNKKCLSLTPEWIMCQVGLTAAYMAAGREAEGQTQAKEILRLYPKFSTETYPFISTIGNPKTRSRYVSYLRTAGLP